MTIYIDIDETICSSDGTGNYENAKPYNQAIEKANQLYDAGHTIVYWTARGTVTGKDWSDVTLGQFKKWGVKFHELKFKKPAFDLFIDDKNINSKNWWLTIDEIISKK